MGFQKCPICNGSRKEFKTNHYVVCRTCKGTGIIDSYSGKPPLSVTPTSSGDFRDDTYRETQQEWLGIN